MLIGLTMYAGYQMYLNKSKDKIIIFQARMKIQLIPYFNQHLNFWMKINQEQLLKSLKIQLLLMLEK